LNRNRGIGTAKRYKKKHAQNEEYDPLEGKIGEAIKTWANLLDTANSTHSILIMHDVQTMRTAMYG
jgi:hypothetical protein